METFRWLYQTSQTESNRQMSNELNMQIFNVNVIVNDELD